MKCVLKPDKPVTYCSTSQKKELDHLIQYWLNHKRRDKLGKQFTQTGK